VDVDHLTDHLCGAKRPGHFRGVCTVVSKLFHIAAPDRAYFGEKDYQQLAVIRQMVEDLNFDVEIVGCPIVRELDGLAKSSRNTYLSPEERKAALVLSRALAAGRSVLERGECSSQVVCSVITAELEEEPLAKIDYVKIVDSKTMEEVVTVDRPVLCAIAVYIGTTRLIDNFTFSKE
jgi:pantoate--beta-alanine ligase